MADNDSKGGPADAGGIDVATRRLSADDVTVAVILPLPREIVGAQLMFSDSLQHQPITLGGSCSLCEVACLNQGDLPHVVALVQPTQTGNTFAAICVIRLKMAFPKLHSVVLCGIAGGVPESKKEDRNVFLGDIVVLNEDGVLPYDFGSLCISNPDEVCEGDDQSYVLKTKAAPTKPDHIFLDIANAMLAANLRGERPWLERLSARLPNLVDRDTRFQRPDEETCPYDEINGRTRVRTSRTAPTKEPRLFVGGIGSGNCVLKHPFRRDDLKEKTPPVVAVEMEAAGVADACAAFDLRFTVVRGICDYCDTTKNDQWQHYAAAVAAAAAYTMIQYIPSREELSKVRRQDGTLAPDTRVFVEAAGSDAFAKGGSAASSVQDVMASKGGPSKSDATSPDALKTTESRAEEARFRLHISGIKKAEANHDYDKALRIAEEMERDLAQYPMQVPDSTVIQSLNAIARVYTTRSGQSEGEERKRWRAHALELVRRARGLQQ